MTTYRVVSEDNSYKVAVNKVEYKVSLSRTGGQGANSNTLGDLPVLLSDVQEGDIITISSNTWVNARRTNLTDGGNF